MVIPTTQHGDGRNINKISIEMGHFIFRTTLMMYGSDARRGSGSVGLLKWHRMSDRTASEYLLWKTKWQRGMVNVGLVLVPWRITTECSLHSS